MATITANTVYLPFLFSYTLTLVNSTIPQFQYALPIYITENPQDCKRQFARGNSALAESIWHPFLEANPNTLTSGSPKALTINNSYNIPQSTLGGFILGSFNFNPSLTSGLESVPKPFPFDLSSDPVSSRNQPGQYVYTESISILNENNKSYIKFVFKNPSQFGGDKLVEPDSVIETPLGAPFPIFVTMSSIGG